MSGDTIKIINLYRMNERVKNVKMTAAEYQKLTEQKSPPSPIIKDMVMAFLVGGHDLHNWAGDTQYLYILRP